MPLLYYNYYFIIDFLICEWYNYTERTFLDREDSMKISEMPTEKQLKHYKELLEKRIATENIKEKLETKLEKEITRNAFKKAGDLFSFPFKKGAFAALLEAILFLGATIIFASCGFFVIWAILFCAIVDFLYIILYGLAYPCMILYFALFKKPRVKSLEKKLKKVKNTLSHMTKKETLQQKIRSLEPKKSESTYSSSSYTSSSEITSTSGITSTDYYKSKVDEYYRQYMGYPPKDDSSLSSLSTDTTLDLHPGDY
jgi:hypothetical protein